MEIKHPGLIDTVRRAGEILLSTHGVHNGIEAKPGEANFVTAYDVAVQKFLFTELSRLYPDAAFIGEEDDEDNFAALKSGRAFVIDPIDGTTNFIKDYRLSAVSVALCDKGTPVVGAVLNPYMNELFYAELGAGAVLIRDGETAPLSVSRCGLSESVILFGTTPYEKPLHDRTFAVARTLFDHALDIRRSGSAALDLCAVAAGRGDVFFELRLSPWDFAAGMLLVTEAGGVITDMEGAPVRLDSRCSVLAGNPTAYAEAKALL